MNADTWIALAITIAVVAVSLVLSGIVKIKINWVKEPPLASIDHPGNVLRQKQDGRYAVTDRNELLDLATALRLWLDKQPVPEPGDFDAFALTLNTLVAKAVLGARWNGDQQRYIRVQERERYDETKSR